MYNRQQKKMQSQMLCIIFEKNNKIDSFRLIKGNERGHKFTTPKMMLWRIMRLSWKRYTNLTDNLSKMRKLPEKNHFPKLTYNMKEKIIKSYFY